MGYFIEIELAFVLRIQSGTKSTPAKNRRPHRPEPDHARALMRAEFRAWRASLPTPLERDTLLMPDVIAETVVQEAERFFQADLPAGWAERLAARAHHLYLCNPHFKKSLNRPQNYGRDMLHTFMRHWTGGWLKREQNPVFRKPPKEYANGCRLPRGN